ncbi:hypothetical protein E4U48_004771, partial [Claviceps purpurea]
MADRYAAKIVSFQYKPQRTLAGNWAKIQDYRRRLINSDIEMKSGYSDNPRPISVADKLAYLYEKEGEPSTASTLLCYLCKNHKKPHTFIDCPDLTTAQMLLEAYKKNEAAKKACRRGTTQVVIQVETVLGEDYDETFAPK